jgi:hypothetical protein
LGLPKGISNRRYSNTIFMSTPERQDFPILSVKLGVLGLPKGISNRRFSHI